MDVFSYLLGFSCVVGLYDWREQYRGYCILNVRLRGYQVFFFLGGGGGGVDRVCCFAMDFDVILRLRVRVYRDFYLRF